MNSSLGRLNVLVIDANEGDVRQIQRVLDLAKVGSFQIVHAPTLSAAGDVLAKGSIHLILADLSLPDSGGLDTLKHIVDLAPGIPVVLHISAADPELALQAIRNGAQDVLVKGQRDPDSLPRALMFAYERQHREERLKDMTLRDELTGLYNQRGFYALASEFAQIARASGRGLLVLFIDLDGLKAINDAYGHSEGTRAIMAAGGVLEATFRDRALLARWGGDEFVILLVETDDVTEATVRDRLQSALMRFNTRMRRGYDLAMSIGSARLDPSDTRSVDALLREADEAMYLNKRARKALRTS